MFLRINCGEHEFIEKRSRFIAIGFGINSRGDVKPIIDGLKEKYADARHVCYGFVADESGDDFGYGDDGEPSGTAGKPIYSALAASGAVRSLIAVVRYFGGIKLGAGGLTRAYRRAAVELIDAVGLSEARRIAEYKVTCDGEAYKRASAMLRNIDCGISNIVYGSAVGFNIVAPCEIDVEGILSPIGITPIKTAERYENIR